MTVVTLELKFTSKLTFLRGLSCIKIDLKLRAKYMHELVHHPLAKLAALVNNSIRKRQKQQIIAITSKIPHHCHYIRIPIKKDRRKCPLVIKIKIKLHITIWSTYQVNYSVGRVLLPCGNVVFIYSQIHTTNTIKKYCHRMGRTLGM